MTLPAHHLELLSPARNAEIGREAILHGADAVYIGGPSFGARSNAENSVEDIAGLVQFAHRYGARIFVALNTILHDSELEAARQLIQRYYDCGVDALIVQDMGLLELDIPPIALHASTQTDIRTVEKARFLGQVGFSQLVLARELALTDIRAIRAATDVPLEYFIHGALCVAFSGQCYISHAHTGRSANRGDCSQACRLPYTLQDAQGRVVAYDKHLLSMKDNNQSDNLEALIDAGIRSFKIEGRYKDVAYVKNITAHYRLLLDEIMERRPEFQRASSGRCQFYFQPNPDKTFNRGATDYFTHGRREEEQIGAFDSPKFVGLPLGDVRSVGTDWFDMSASETMANGDGLTYMHKREVVGIAVNRAEAHGDLWRIYPKDAIATLPGFKPGIALSRNRDHSWEQALTRRSADRYLDLWLEFAETEQGFALQLTDEDGVQASASLIMDKQPAQNPQRAEGSVRENLGKLGATLFRARDLQITWSQPWFVPASSLNQLRREAIERLQQAREQAWVRPPRLPAVQPPVAYPEEMLNYLANVYNHKARAFYEKHGVKLIAAAYEAHEEAGEVPLMITKHCLRFSYNLCPKQARGIKGVQGQVRAEPMTLINGKEVLTLKFDCKPCEMHVIGSMKKHIFASPPPTTVPSAVPVTFFKTRPQAS